MDSNLEKINKAALKFLIPQSIEETYKTIIGEAIGLVNGDDAAIIIKQNNSFKVVCASSHELLIKQIRRKGFAYEAFRSGKSFIVYKKEMAKYHPEDNLKRQSYIFISLSYQGKSVGVLVVRSNKNKNFSKKELDILNLFGAMASLAIKKTQLYDEVKNALHARDLFISMASHEIKTPLTSVNGYSRLLYDKLSKLKKPEAKWTKHLYLETMRLSNLMEELLVIDKIRSGKLQYVFRECKLKDIINRALTSFSLIKRDAKIVFEYTTKNDEDTIIADPDKMIQAIINLLDNAVKFSKAGKEVRISLKSGDQDLLIEVKDEGKGMSRRDALKIFNEYYRGKNARHEGMGLGLYLVKNIIDQHKGTIKIQSQPNKGTLMRIELPKIKI